MHSQAAPLALIADVHANLEALDAVLADIDATVPEARLVCAGDLVGYGPSPNECVERLRERRAVSVIGNHDEMVLEKRDFSRCNYAGITAALWTRSHLTEEARAYLADLPVHAPATPDVAVCHGDLDDADTYVSDELKGAEALRQLRSHYPQARILVCGHTHFAAIYQRDSGFSSIDSPGERHLLPGEPSMINPGAVGQSRDGSLLARYAVVDTARGVVDFRAIDYDHETTVRKLRSAGLVPKVTMPRPQGARKWVARLKDSYARRWIGRDELAGRGGT